MMEGVINEGVEIMTGGVKMITEGVEMMIEIVEPIEEATVLLLEGILLEVVCVGKIV